MKRLITPFLALLTLCGLLTACAAPATPAPEATGGPVATAGPVATDAPAQTEPPALAGTPDMEEVKQGAEAMMPILDSIVRTMGIGGDTPYAPRDAEFFWSVLYHMGENWGHTHPLVERKEDGAVIVPRQVMQEFATAAFLDYDGLLPLPQSLAQALAYDEGLDAYRLAPSDMGATETRLEEVFTGADGVITARVSLNVGPDELLGMLDFQLAPNPYAAGVSEPVYHYSVCGAQNAAPQG